MFWKCLSSANNVAQIYDVKKCSWPGCRSMPSFKPKSEIFSDFVSKTRILPLRRATWADHNFAVRCPLTINTTSQSNVLSPIRSFLVISVTLDTPVALSNHSRVDQNHQNRGKIRLHISIIESFRPKSESIAHTDLLYRLFFKNVFLSLLAQYRSHEVGLILTLHFLLSMRLRNDISVRNNMGS